MMNVVIPQPSPQRIALNALNTAWADYHSTMHTLSNMTQLSLAFLSYIVSCPDSALHLSKVVDGVGRIYGFTSLEVFNEEYQSLESSGFHSLVFQSMNMEWSEEAREFCWGYLDILAWRLVRKQEGALTFLSLPQEAWTHVVNEACRMTCQSFDEK